MEKKRRVEFIEYDGKYPNLCHGVLTVRIDGYVVKFGHNYDFGNVGISNNGGEIFKDEVGCPHEEAFWRSGGDVWFDKDGNDHVETGEWLLSPDELNAKYWDVADELIDVVNENVPYGCCGGCA